MAHVNNDEPEFLSGSLMRHVVITSMMASIGLMAIFAVDLIDMVFISMLGSAELAAAVGYAGIVLFFTNSVCIGLSIASGSLVAKAIGAKETRLAREYASATIIAGVLIGIAVAGLLLFYLDSVLSSIGASGLTAQLATSYLNIIVPSMPVVAVAIIAMGVLRAHGDTKLAMYATIAGGLANAILDPILIFWAGLGLEGAAMASVVARFVMVLLAVTPLVKRFDALAPLRFHLLVQHFGTIGAIAGPAVLTNVATPIGTAIMTREMAKFGTDAVAGMAIISRLTPVAFSVVFALSGAIGPIVGQNFGAGQMDRVRTTFSNALKFLAVYVVLVTLILYFLRDAIVNLFSAQGIAVELVFLFCGVLAMAFIFNGFMFVANALFNNLGWPMYSTLLNWGRHTLGTLPFVLIGAHYAGAKGVLLGQAAGGIVFAALAIYLAIRVMRQAAATPIKHEHHKSVFHLPRLWQR